MTNRLQHFDLSIQGSLTLWKSLDKHLCSAYVFAWGFRKLRVQISNQRTKKQDKKTQPYIIIKDKLLNHCATTTLFYFVLLFRNIPLICPWTVIPCSEDEGRGILCQKHDACCSEFRGQRPVCLKWTNAKFCTFNELQREETWCQGLSYPDARVWRRRCLWNARGPPNTASTAGCPPWPSLHRRACSGRSRLHSGTCLDQDPPMCRLVF